MRYQVEPLDPSNLPGSLAFHLSRPLSSWVNCGGIGVLLERLTGDFIFQPDELFVVIFRRRRLSGLHRRWPSRPLRSWCRFAGGGSSGQHWLKNSSIAGCSAAVIIRPSVSSSSLGFLHLSANRLIDALGQFQEYRVH